ncbi:MAG: hypothetical protein ACRBN8_37755 [Nannocystales bacterium]
MTQLDELVSAAKSLDDQAPPPEAETRMWGKIAAQAGGAAVLGMAAATVGAKTASASTAAVSTAAASTAAVSTAAASSAATTSIALTVAKVATVLAVTAGVGVGVVTVASPPEPQVTTQAVAVEAGPKAEPERGAKLRTKTPEPVVEDDVEILSVIETPEVTETSEVDTAAPRAPKAKARPRRHRPESEPPTASALAAESALLGKARVASSGGRNTEALAALRLHAKRHPKGELVEVRRALEVRVLCELGRTDAARKAADRFLARHKASALAGQVRSSCAYE